MVCTQEAQKQSSSQPADLLDADCAIEVDIEVESPQPPGPANADGLNAGFSWLHQCLGIHFDR